MTKLMIRKTHRNFIFAFFLLAAAACGKRVYVVESLIPRQEIVIDGKADDWKGALSFVDEEALFIGFQNDRSHLFICLQAGTERVPRRLLRQGMTVWFDPTGEKKKTLGVRYPLGGPLEVWDRQMMRDQPGEAQEKRPEDLLDELEVLRSGKGPPERMTLDEAKKDGLEVRVDSSGGFFAYELKIPLAPSANRRFSLGIQPDAVIGIGFETEKWTRERTPGGTPGDIDGGRGGMGGRPGGMGGRPGRMGRGGEAGMIPDIPEPIKIWARVRLASGERGDQPGILEITPEPPGR
ncbi:MAG: hypothetical protein WAU81_07945 [Candidatus Aminicenantales bacterium]